MEPVTPIPELDELHLDAAKVALGEALYHDPTLSAGGQVSCASCHNLEKGGSDGREFSIGVEGRKGNINSPTTFNSGLSFAQLWSGGAADLAQQVSGPLHNPVEMAADWPQVVDRLKKEPTYQKRFADAWPGKGITAQTIAESIAVFEQSLVTPDSRFDLFLKGDASALSAKEKRGWQLFKERGCISCHQGRLLGGNMYQSFGIMRKYITHRKLTNADLGRYMVTGREADRSRFKVPTLRNIELTGPWLHDGSADNLGEVLKVMWENQLGRVPDPDESEQIIAFLKTLTGRYRGEQL